MLNHQVVNITNATNGTTLTSYSPFDVSFTTWGYSTSNKVWKIDYNFGNGKNETVEFKPMLETSSSYALSAEPGDPRNTIVNSYYFFDDTSSKDYNVKINFYVIGSETPETVNFTLSLRLAKIEDIFSSASTIKLVGSRMFGLDNQILYLFESQSPNYLLPVLAKF